LKYHVVSITLSGSLDPQEWFRLPGRHVAPRHKAPRSARASVGRAVGQLAGVIPTRGVAGTVALVGAASVAVGLGVLTAQSDSSPQQAVADVFTGTSSDADDLLADRDQTADDQASRSGRRPALVSVQRATKSQAMPVSRQDVAGAVSETVEATDPRDIALGMLGDYGWGTDEFSCLDSLYMHESGWNPLAENSSSGAYGIPQSLPGDKMAVYGSDWQTNPTTQLEWGLAYIQDRYGSPCGAWNFWLGNNFY
jgi:hypothetical protein